MTFFKNRLFIQFPLTLFSHTTLFIRVFLKTEVSKNGQKKHLRIHKYTKFTHRKAGINLKDERTHASY